LRHGSEPKRRIYEIHNLHDSIFALAFLVIPQRDSQVFHGTPGRFQGVQESQEGLIRQKQFGFILDNKEVNNENEKNKQN